MNPPTSTEKITQPNRAVARLSDPAMRWASALYDPRSLSEEPAVPHGTALSQKVKVFSRGSMSTGTTGYGFVTLAPFNLSASNTSPIQTTTSASLMTSSSALSSTATVATADSNAPYTTSQIGLTAGKVNYKLVGAAIYVKYAGTELNRGGDMLLFEESQHGSVYPYSYNTAMGQDFVKRVPVSNEWQHVCYTPNADFECEWMNSNSSPSLVAFPFLSVLINSAGTPQPFDYEVFAWFEYTGTIARGATSSYNDGIGYAALVGAANQFQQLDSVLGIDGFLHSVNNQMDNFSGVARSATHQQNFAGLAAFLPQLMSVAKRGAGALAKEFLPGLISQDKGQKKAVKQLVKSVVKGKPPKPTKLK